MLTITKKSRRIRLAELANGSLFEFEKTLALKTEYRTDQGAVEAYIVGSGEFFWGGTSTAEKQRNLLVHQVFIQER